MGLELFKGQSLKNRVRQKTGRGGFPAPPPLRLPGKVPVLSNPSPRRAAGKTRRHASSARPRIRRSFLKKRRSRPQFLDGSSPAPQHAARCLLRGYTAANSQDNTLPCSFRTALASLSEGYPFWNDP